MTDEEAMRCIDYIRDNAPKYAEAKAQSTFLEKFLNSKKSMLMSEETGTLGAREAYAYAHPDYVEVLRGLKESVAVEHEIKCRIDAAKMKFEFWKTQQFNTRVEARAMS
jgi:hypothetical protein